MAVPTEGPRRLVLPATLVEVTAHRLRDAMWEALRLPASQGLVEHLPRRGSRVGEWSPTDILQRLELRNCLIPAVTSTRCATPSASRRAV
ncbi:hypothetical protein ACAG24_022580 [Mycobacterium sp. pW049]|uniref:hypothetical protein n=1 Tax=[Mycobacterium] bulgaricum TaxID=3238985 RepID=UPI00351B57D6